MRTKVLVTGAAGFIGSHLCREIADTSDARIIGIDNLRSGDWTRTPDNVERVEADIGLITSDEWNDLCSGVDVVFHLAAEKYNSSKSTPDKLMLANVVATEHLARAASRSGVRRFVFTSSLYAYGSMGPSTMYEDDLPTPNTLYGASKVMGEHTLRAIDREIGLEWNVARLFFIYGPRQYADGGYKSVIVSNFERLMNSIPATIYGDGKQSLDYVFVDDCVKALLKLGEAPVSRQIVNIASGRETSVLELTKLMTSIAGQPDNSEMKAADWTAGSRRVGNPNLARQIFGWEATTAIESGLNLVYEWMIGSRK